MAPNCHISGKWEILSPVQHPLAVGTPDASQDDSWKGRGQWGTVSYIMANSTGSG